MPSCALIMLHITPTITRFSNSFFFLVPSLGSALTTYPLFYIPTLFYEYSSFFFVSYALYASCYIFVSLQASSRHHTVTSSYLFYHPSVSHVFCSSILLYQFVFVKCAATGTSSRSLKLGNTNQEECGREPGGKNTSAVYRGIKKKFMQRPG